MHSRVKRSRGIAGASSQLNIFHVNPRHFSVRVKELKCQVEQIKQFHQHTA